MQTIRLTTWINAPVERCFLLSLSINLHVDAARSTAEKAAAGTTSGLIRLGEKVTFSGRHFGLRVGHTSLIDAWRPYTYFRDVMVEGHFEKFEHEHHFAPMNDGTRMRDEIHFVPPVSILGRLFEGRLRSHLKRFLTERNNRIKHVAESDQWHQYLDGQPPLTPPGSTARRKPA